MKNVNINMERLTAAVKLSNKIDEAVSHAVLEVEAAGQEFRKTLEVLSKKQHEDSDRPSRPSIQPVHQDEG